MAELIPAQGTQGARCCVTAKAAGEIDFPHASYFMPLNTTSLLLVVTGDWSLNYRVFRYIYGITSFGEGCGKRGKFGIYARVSNYRNWVQSVIASSFT